MAIDVELLKRLANARQAEIRRRDEEIARLKRLLQAQQLEKASALRRAEAIRKATIEEAATVAENLSYGLSIDEFMRMTKKEHGAFACRKAAEEIRKLAGEVQNGADPR